MEKYMDDNFINLYDFLDIEYTEDLDLINDRIKELRKKFRKRVNSSNAEVRNEVERQLQILDNAVKTFKNEDSKRDYDRELLEYLDYVEELDKKEREKEEEYIRTKDELNKLKETVNTINMDDESAEAYFKQAEKYYDENKPDLAFEYIMKIPENKVKYLPYRCKFAMANFNEDVAIKAGDFFETNCSDDAEGLDIIAQEYFDYAFYTNNDNLKNKFKTKSIDLFKKSYKIRPSKNNTYALFYDSVDHNNGYEAAKYGEEYVNKFDPKNIHVYMFLSDIYMTLRDDSKVLSNARLAYSIENNLQTTESYIKSLVTTKSVKSLEPLMKAHLDYPSSDYLRRVIQNFIINDLNDNLFKSNGEYRISNKRELKFAKKIIPYIDQIKYPSDEITRIGSMIKYEVEKVQSRQLRYSPIKTAIIGSIFLYILKSLTSSWVTIAIFVAIAINFWFYPKAIKIHWQDRK